MAPPITSTSTFVTRLPSSSSLVDTFEPPTIAATGRCRVAQRGVQRLQLRLHQPAGMGGQQPADALRAGVRPVRGGERVVHEHLGQRGELAGQRRVVRLLAGMVARVLQQQHVAVRNAATAACATGPVLSSAKRTGWPSTSASATAIGASDMCGTRLPFGRSKWLNTITFAPPSASSRMVGDQALDAGQVGDAAVAHRHVEVGAHQHAPAPDVQPVQRAVPPCYRLPNRAAVSLMRELKPHSLSYQPATRTICPPSTEAVCVASNEQETPTWLKSLLTSLAVL